jgi:YVTN family beta-propeller protein
VVTDERRFPGRQGRFLFAYLVAEQGRAVPRDELAEALWGEDPPATWDKALTVLVSKLRGLLAEHGIDGSKALTGAFGCYRLDLPEGSWIDVVAAGSAAQEAEEALTAGDLGKARAAAALAASVVRQPFLPGEGGAWVEEKRRELMEVHVRALNVLTDACLRSRNAQAAAKWAEEAVALAPFRETGYRRLMEARVAAGDRAEALRVYERCRRLLAEELGAYPSPETESIYRELLETASSPEARASATKTAPVAVLASKPDEEAAPPAPLRRSRGRRFPVAIGVALLLATAITVATVELTGGERSPSLVSAAGNSVAVLDPDTSRLVAEVPVGNGPTKIALGEGAAWVINADDETVERIDPATSTVRQTVRVGSGPTSIAVGAGSVWVANGLDGTVSRIDPKTNTVVQRISVGNGPSGIAVGEGSVWAVNRDDHTLSRIDPRSGQVVRTLDAGTDPMDVAVGAGAIWVTNESTGRVIKIDPASSRILDAVSVGRGSAAVTAGAGAIWVANVLDGTVSRIDPVVNVVTHTIPVPDGPAGLSVGLGSVWVCSEFGGSISRIDPARNVVSRSIRIGGRPTGMVASPGGLFVAVRPAGGAHQGGTLTALMAAALPPDSIDPALSYDVVTGGLLSLAYDGLTAFKRVGGSEGTQLVPDLAASLPTPANGGRSYTFRLRPGIRYSTGEPVRPADFRRALERVFDLRSPAAVLYRTIEGTEACLRGPGHCDLSRGIVGDARARTVTLRLTEPDPELLYKLALSPAFAIPYSTASRTAGRHPLPGTGAYAISAYVPGRRLRFARNPRFREWSRAARPTGYPDEIVFEYGSFRPGQLRAIMSGTADYLFAPPSELVKLRPQHASQLHSNARLGTWYVFLNTRVPPFDDVRVRRALNYAVDRQALVRAFGGPSSAQPTCQILPPSFPGYRRYCPFRHDLAKARRLVAASGTRGMSVVVWTPSSTVSFESRIVSALSAIGYRARLEVEDGIWNYKRIQAGAHTWFADYPAASDFAPLFSCRSRVAPNNPAQFCDPAVERTIARARELEPVDPRAANGLWARIDRMVTDRAPYVPLLNPRRVEYVSARVGNYQFNPQLGTLFDQLWVR